MVCDSCFKCCRCALVERCRDHGRRRPFGLVARAVGAGRSSTRCYPAGLFWLGTNDLRGSFVRVFSSTLLFDSFDPFETEAFFFFPPNIGTTDSTGIIAVLVELCISLSRPRPGFCIAPCTRVSTLLLRDCVQVLFTIRGVAGPLPGSPPPWNNRCIYVHAVCS